MTINTLASIAVTASVIVGVTAVAGQQRSAFHAEARLVVLHVTVTNDRGEIVTNLDRSAFRVFEDGRPQVISLFGHDDVPISLGLVIDNSGSMKAFRSSVEAAALAFVRASNPLDEVFVLNFADTPRIDVPFTSDVSVLEAGVARVDSIGGTAVRDALDLGETYLRDRAIHDRRALLVITNGNDNASAVSRSQLRRTVERSRTAIFAVDLVPEHMSGNERPSDVDLAELTRISGGVMQRVGSIADVNKVVLDIAQQIRHEYTIAYTPENLTLDGSFRAVRIKVAESGLTARTRPGYWATGRQ